MKKIVLLFTMISLLGLISCNDWLTVYPEDDIVGDKYWKNADQVQTVVASCYRWLANSDCLTRMIVWGELRSDNVEAGSAASTDEKNLINVNVLSSNSLTSWDCFYKVINICNNVIKKAPGAMAYDTNYREDEMNANVAEALTIRSLCYFYLIRTYGDVPLVTQPSESESVDYNTAQSSADSVIVPQLISDLKEAETKASTTWGTEAENKGRITRNAVRALLADVYLWAGQYQKCIDECDAVLNDPTMELEFVDGDKYINKVFYNGNSTESIFELNYTNNALTSTTIQNMYGNSNQALSAHLVATQVLYTNGFTYDAANVDTVADERGIGSMTYSTGSHSIFKYTGQTPGTFDNYHSSGSYTFRTASSQADWIIYRLSDIYLMKAEALANIATTQAQVDEVATLCNVTFRRATMDKDSLSHSLFAVGVTCRNMVLEERRREFCFEGKRWFDLLRRIRQDGNVSYPLSLMNIRYSGEQDAELRKTKLSHTGAWYLPIYTNQISINKNLHQNDYYSTQE
jgi:starch-binding outer membrane protein, SusD/RagB family